MSPPLPYMAKEAPPPRPGPEEGGCERARPLPLNLPLDSVFLRWNVASGGESRAATRVAMATRPQREEDNGVIIPVCHAKRRGYKTLRV